MSDFNEVYLNHPLRFSEGQCKYLSTTYNYMKLAQQASEQYGRMYLDYKDFKTFLKTGIEDGYRLIGRYLEMAVQELVSLGFYDVNTKVLTSEYGEFVCEDWSKVENIVDELCQSSNREVAEAEQYRAMRKASRGRLVGGGFGIKGAAKGIALAGAFNAITGLAHSGVNAIGNSNTRVTQQRKLNDYYSSNETLQTLKQCIAICIQKLGAVVLEYQGLYRPENIVGTEDMKERVRALRNNYSRVPDNEKSSVAIQMLTLDPMDLDTYQFLLQQYGDQDGVLFKLSDIIGFSGEYRKLISKFREPALANVKNSMCSELKQLQMSSENQGKVIEIRDRYKEKVKDAVSYYGGGLGADEYIGELHQQYIKQLSNLRESGFEQLLKALSAEMKPWRRSDYTQDKILELKDRYYEKANAMIEFYEGDITFRPYYGTINSEIEKQFRSFIESNYFSSQTISGTKNLSLAETDLRVLYEEMPDFLKKAVEESLKKIHDISKDVDEKERTYLGTVFDTVEDRQKAESDHQRLNQEYSEISADVGMLPPHVQFQKLNNLRQNIVQDSGIAPCVKNDLQSKINPDMERLIQEDQQRRTFNNKIYDTEEECNTVRRDYERLTGKFANANASYTYSDLKSAIKSCKSGNYHPTASQLALELLEPKAKELRRSERSSTRGIISWAFNVVYIALIVLVFVKMPTLYENGASKTLMEVINTFLSEGSHITFGNGIFIFIYVCIFGAYISQLKEFLGDIKSCGEPLALVPCVISILMAAVWAITFVLSLFGVDYHCVSGFYLLMFGGLGIGITGYIINEVY